MQREISAEPEMNGHAVSLHYHNSNAERVVVVHKGFLLPCIMHDLPILMGEQHLPFFDFCICIERLFSLFFPLKRNCMNSCNSYLSRILVRVHISAAGLTRQPIEDLLRLIQALALRPGTSQRVHAAEVMESRIMQTQKMLTHTCGQCGGTDGPAPARALQRSTPAPRFGSIFSSMPSAEDRKDASGLLLLESATFKACLILTRDGEVRSSFLLFRSVICYRRCNTADQDKRVQHSRTICRSSLLPLA